MPYTCYLKQSDFYTTNVKYMRMPNMVVEQLQRATTKKIDIIFKFN